MHGGNLLGSQSSHIPPSAFEISQTVDALLRHYRAVHVKAERLGGDQRAHQSIRGDEVIAGITFVSHGRARPNLLLSSHNNPKKEDVPDASSGAQLEKVSDGPRTSSTMLKTRRRRKLEQRISWRVVGLASPDLPFLLI